MSDPATDETFHVILPEAPPSKLFRERGAFYRLLPELMKTHRGQYVAIHDEHVVDAGPERLPLALRVQARVRAGVYIGLVDENPEPMVRAGSAVDVVRWSALR